MYKVVGLYNQEGIDNREFVENMLNYLRDHHGADTELGDCQCDHASRFGIVNFPTFLLLKDKFLLRKLEGRYPVIDYVKWYGS